MATNNELKLAILEGAKDLLHTTVAEDEFRTDDSSRYICHAIKAASKRMDATHFDINRSDNRVDLINEIEKAIAPFGTFDNKLESLGVITKDEIFSDKIQGYRHNFLDKLIHKYVCLVRQGK